MMRCRFVKKYHYCKKKIKILILNRGFGGAGRWYPGYPEGGIGMYRVPCLQQITFVLTPRSPTPWQNEYVAESGPWYETREQKNHGRLGCLLRRSGAGFGGRAGGQRGEARGGEGVGYLGI